MKKGCDLIRQLIRIRPKSNQFICNIMFLLLQQPEWLWKTIVNTFWTCKSNSQISRLIHFSTPRISFCTNFDHFPSPLQHEAEQLKVLNFLSFSFNIYIYIYISYYFTVAEPLCHWTFRLRILSFPYGEDSGSWGMLD